MTYLNPPIFHPVQRRLALVTLGLTLAISQASHGAIVVQELFDAIAGPPPGVDVPLDGLGDTTTTIGLTDLWNAYGNLGIYTASNFNPGLGLLGPSSNNGQDGGVWNRGSSYATNIFATRTLTTPIDFGKDQVLYYSYIANNSGDTAMGIGFTTPADGSFEFVGAGLSWNNARSLATGEIDASNAAYICYGTLDADSGPYGVRAHEAMNSINAAAFVVVRLTIHANSPDVIDMKRYGVGDPIDTDPTQVVWSASDAFDTSMVATNLLLWLNGVSGTNAGEVDAIRVGTTWADVTGTTPGSDPYTTWIGGPPYNLTGTDALPAADPDHDGITNGIEFVLGGNPTAAGDASKLPATAIVGSNLEFTYRRTDLSNAAPLPFVEYGSTLIGWTQAQNGVNGVTITASDDFYGAGVDKVVVDIPLSLGNGKAMFARLNANR